MKTTLDLPAPLMREVKIRAATESKKLKDLVAELLKRGLDTSLEPSPPSDSPPFTIAAETGFPTIPCLQKASISPVPLDESLELIEDANQEEDLRHAGLLD